MGASERRGTMFPEVIVSGSPYDRGRQYGAQARDRVRGSITSYAEHYD